MPQVKYKCRNTGKYPLPETITEWPVCTKKPVRPEIKRAIQVNIYLQGAGCLKITGSEFKYKAGA